MKLKDLTDAELIAELRTRGYGVLGEAKKEKRCVCGTPLDACRMRGSHRPCCARCSETGYRSHG